MTCIAAIADPATGKVWMGADTCGTRGNAKQELAESKIWKIEWNSNTWIFGITGNPRFTQFFRYCTSLPEACFDRDKDTILSYLVKNWIPELRENAIRNDVLSVKDGSKTSESLVLIATQGKIYNLEANFGIVEQSTPFYAVGSGGEFAHGVLFGMESCNSLLTAEQRITTAIQGSARFCPGVGGRIDLLSS